jgi:hypothetical protein
MSEAPARPTLAPPEAGGQRSRRSSSTGGPKEKLDFGQKLVVCKRKGAVLPLIGINNNNGQSGVNSPWNKPAQLLFPAGIIALGTRTAASSVDDSMPPVPQAAAAAGDAAVVPNDPNNAFNLGFPINQDDPFFVVVTPECVDDAKDRRKVGLGVFILCIINLCSAIALAASGQGATSRVTGESNQVVGLLWMLFTLFSVLVQIVGTLRGGGLILTIALCTVMTDIISGFLRAYTAAGAIQLTSQALSLILLTKLRSLWSPLWFSPTMT